MSKETELKPCPFCGGEAENYKSIAEHQQKLSMDRYFEIKQLKQELDKAKGEVDLYKQQVDELEDELATTYNKLEKAKAEADKWHARCVDMHSVAEARSKYVREIFEELESIFDKKKYVLYPLNAITKLKKKYTELKKKYTEGTNDR